MFSNLGCHLRITLGTQNTQVSQTVQWLCRSSEWPNQFLTVNVAILRCFIPATYIIIGTGLYLVPTSMFYFIILSF